MSPVAHLFIQPHLDDVALSVGGTVAGLAGAGDEVLIATVFSALPAHDVAGELIRLAHEAWGDPTDPWPLRRAEDAAAATALGASTRWLGEAEAIYRDGRYLTGASLRGPVHPDDAPVVHRIGERLVALWRECGAPIVYLPLGIGGHVDHLLVHEAGAALCRVDAAVRYYEDFPYTLLPGAREARLAALGSARLVPELVDVTDTLARRLSAIAEYRSQLTLLFRPGGSFAGDWRELVTREAAMVAGGGGAAERLWRPGA